MLVSIHKPMMLLLLLGVGFSTVNAQVWTLDQCIDTAQVHNKTLQIDRNEIAWSSEKAKEAKANLIPKVTANADYKYFTNLPYQLMPLSTFNPTAPEGQYKETQFGVPHNINANIQVAMPLYNPQVYGAIKSTKIGYEVAQLQYQKTAEEVYLEISNLYYNAQILYHQTAFIDSNLINAKQLLNNMELLHEQLMAKGTDVNKVRLQLSQLSTQKENVYSKYLQVLNALKFTMGIPLDRDIQIEPGIQYTSANEQPVNTVIDISLIKTKKRLLSNELNTLQKSRYLPNVNLFANYGTAGFGYDEPPNEFLNFYPIGFAGIQLSYPLFNGTVTKRKINQKNIELQNNALQLNLLTEKNKMEIENAKMQRNIAEQTIENSKEQLAQAKSIYKQTVLQQKQGTANLTDVLLADNDVREAQQAYLTAEVDYLKSELELKKLSGNLSIKHQ
jgi:OMF family outer membrane factor